MAVFPEFCLSGYFWEDEPACRAYMNEAVTENHKNWIDGTLKPLLDDQFELVILNNLTRGSGAQVLQHHILCFQAGF